MRGFTVALRPERRDEQVRANALPAVKPVHKIVRFQHVPRFVVDHAFLQQRPGT